MTGGAYGTRAAAALYLRLLAAAAGPADGLEIASAIGRALWARLAGGRGALHVRRPVVVKRGALRWWVPPFDNSFATTTPGDDNGAVLSEILRQLERRAAGVFVDVGANIGYLCLTVAARFPDVEVVAIEPIPWLAEALRRSAALSGLRRVKVVECAIAASPSVDLTVPVVRRVHLTTLSTALAGDRGEFGTTSTRSVSVRGAGLDDVLDGLGIAPERVALLKIDVEGAEAAVLATARRLLAARPAVVFEALDEERLRAVMDALQDGGTWRVTALDRTNHVAEVPATGSGVRTIGAEPSVKVA